jgi:hypothetical protein
MRKPKKSKTQKNFGDTAVAVVRPCPKADGVRVHGSEASEARLVATMTREQEARCQGCGGAFMKATVTRWTLMDVKGAIQRPRLDRAGQYCWQCEAARNAQGRCRQGAGKRRSWRQAKHVGACFADPVANKRIRLLRFYFCSEAGAIVVFSSAGIGSNCQSEIVYTVPLNSHLIDFVQLFLPRPRYSPAIHHPPPSVRRWWTASGLPYRGRTLRPAR